MKVIFAHTDEEYAKLESKANKANLELRWLFRVGTLNEYKTQAEVARGLTEKLAAMQEEQMVARETISNLEAGQFAKVFAKYDWTKAELSAAKAALVKAKQENLVLRPRPVFLYPIGQSVPAIEFGLGELCPICTQRFVAKAAILGSCGCLFHNICAAEMIDSGDYICSKCSDLDPAWVAQWDGKLDENQEREVEVTVDKLKSTATDGAPKPNPKPKGSTVPVLGHVGSLAAADNLVVPASDEARTTKHALLGNTVLQSDFVTIATERAPPPTMVVNQPTCDCTSD